MSTNYALGQLNEDFRRLTDIISGNSGAETEAIGKSIEKVSNALSESAIAMEKVTNALKNAITDSNNALGTSIGNAISDTQGDLANKMGDVITKSNASLADAITESIIKIQGDLSNNMGTVIKENNTKLLESITNTSKRTNETNILFKNSVILDKYNDSILSFPYLNDTNYISGWKSISTDNSITGENRDKSIRYDSFILYLFRNFNNIYSFDKTTINDYIPVSKIIKTHKIWWLTNKTNYSWTPEFITFVDSL